MSAVTRLAFRAKEALLRRGTMPLLPEALAFQGLSRSEIERITQERLANTIRFAAEHVPAYKRLWSGLDLDDALASSEAFAQLPILERADLSAAGRELIAPDTSGTVETTSTSGSSGDHLVFCTDRIRAGWSMAARIRALRWWGLDYGARTVRMIARPYMEGQSWRGRLSYAKLLVANRLSGTTRLSAFDMSGEDMAHHAQRLRRIQPEMICGYAGSLQRLGEYLDRTGPLASRRLKAVIYGSEPIAGSRDEMARGYGAPITQEYISREFGLVAHECPHGNLHVSEDNVYLEVIDGQNRPVVGQVGQVILTDLRTSRTPFIRYRLGDLAELAPADEVCPCGCNLRILRRLAGRKHEQIPLRDGGSVPPYAASCVTMAMPEVRHFQVRVRGDRLRVLVEVDETRLATKRDDMIAWLEHRVNHEYAIAFEAVDRIAPEPSGKYAQLVFEAEPAPRPQDDRP